MIHHVVAMQTARRVAEQNMKERAASSSGGASPVGSHPYAKDVSSRRAGGPPLGYSKAGEEAFVRGGKKGALVGGGVAAVATLGVIIAAGLAAAAPVAIIAGTVAPVVGYLVGGARESA